MFRNLSSSVSQPFNVRRRHQARHEAGFQHSSQWDSTGLESEGWSGNLDLSIHHPSAPFGNRFDALTAPPPVVTRERVFHISSPRRRTRHSRGSKEAKKRRDAKRNRRKFAAQFLDEQLSREIDETLANANIYPPESASEHVNTPSMQTAFVPQAPICTSLSRYTPLPPQLPPLNFGRLDFRDFPGLPTPRHSPPLPTPSPVYRGVPSWCPPIPSRMQNGMWSDSPPKFWDLSKLPEPKKALGQEKTCQDLQLWKGTFDLKQKKQSRFFPSSLTSKPVVKLPPTACKLHSSEDVHQEVATSAFSAPTTAQAPEPFMTAVDKIIAAVQAETNTSSISRDPPSAANLWHILRDALDYHSEDYPVGDTRSWTDDTDDTGGVTLDPLCDTHGQAAELEATDLPYVHGNSLTGHANETAAYHGNRYAKDQIISDSAIYLADMLSPIDSDSPPYELAAMPWPLTPRSATPLPAYESVASLTKADHEFNAATNTDADDIAASIEQIKSEQQLFDPVELPLPRSPAESECDLAMFLSMGHVENCWCRDCNEAPEVVEEETQTPLTEDDDGWLVWSSAESSSGTETSTQAPTTVNVGPEYKQEAVERDASEFTIDWDDFFPHPPTCLQEPGFEDEDIFLGYYDDGMAFARDDEYDWLWNL